MHSTTGPIMLDLLGTELSSEERELLQHPLVGGVILFTRNYISREQITALCQAIRKARPTPLLIAVDHEGGRVQRFKEGFTLLPSMGHIGQLYEKSQTEALKLAHWCGKTLANELISVGIDMSFTPVLDLNKGISQVVGDRSFSVKSEVVISLASALVRGMKEEGMAATGKHFPGHGSVVADSHAALPIDNRTLVEITRDDMTPFLALIQTGIRAMMPAHILFPEVDDKPVGFSKRWLQDILRHQCGFSGVIFSDDLNMAGASMAGDYADRAEAALTAGCDIALICNNRAGAIQILDHLPQHYSLDNNKFQSLSAGTDK